VAALVALGAAVATSFLVSRPATQRLYDALSAAAPPGSVEAQVNAMVGSFMGGSFMGILMLVFYLPYPILLIYYFTRPRLREAMSRPRGERPV
jgi:hypothetical protein